MDKIYKIASSPDIHSINAAKQIISQNKGANHILINENHSFPSIKGDLNAKEFDFVCLPLHLVPFGMPDGMVIAGVSERSNCKLQYIGRPEANDGNSLRDFKAGGKLLVESLIIKDQLEKLLPQANIQVSDDSVLDMHKRLQDKSIDGYVSPVFNFTNNKIDTKGYYQWELSPYEVVGTSGAGVTAYICRMDDIVSRKLIREFHHVQTSRCTNVERKILRSFDHPNVGAYCFLDDRNYFQIHASYSNGSHERCFYTQSTSDSLAEKIIEIFKNEADISLI